MRPLAIIPVTILFLAASAPQAVVVAFAPPSSRRSTCNAATGGAFPIHASSISPDSEQQKGTAAATTEAAVSKLKKVLEREYISFFNPMEDAWYSPSVSFVDPMTELSGVDSYRNNVDMLASRTLLGKVLFDDGGIILHSVIGGEVSDDGTQISDIITRWTLKVTAKVLPWKPTARFSGISVYKVEPDVKPSSSTGVQIIGQTDYWDSINLVPNSGGEYGRVDKGIAISDFLGQLKPGGPRAQAAAPELPYELLRRGDGYDVRRYPSYAGVKLPYKRRDEGFGSLGAFTRGMNPLGPAIMEVEKSDTSDKYMMWPLSYAMPGEDVAAVPVGAAEKAGEGQWRTMKVVTVPGPVVVAVREFTDASMEPVVRKADRELRELLKRDGLVPKEGSEEAVRFAQYDAIFSMGQRRGEVWIDLGEHPW